MRKKVPGEAAVLILMLLLAWAILAIWLRKSDRRDAGKSVFVASETTETAREGGPPPEHATGSEPEEPTDQYAAPTPESEELLPLAKWVSVPDSLAMAGIAMIATPPAPGSEPRLIDPGRLPGGVRPVHPIEVLWNLWSWKAFLSPDEFDKLNRSWALVSCLDFLLGRAAGLQLAERMSVEGKFYFPMVVAKGFLAPQDPADLTTRLSTLIHGGFEELVRQIPEQYQGPALESAFRARAVMALASLGRTSDTTTALAPFVADQDPRVRGAAAFGLAVQGKPEAAIQMLSRADDSADARALLGALGSYDYRYDPPELTIGYDRTVDSHILKYVRRIGASAPDSDAFHTGLWALSFRVERPEIAEYMVSLARKEPTQEIALALANAGRIFSNYAPYGDTIKRWLDSSSDQIRILALMGLTWQRIEDLPRRVLSLVEGKNPALARQAVLSLQGTIETNPSDSLELIRSAVSKWPDERDVLFAAESLLRSIARNQEIVGTWKAIAKQMLQDVRAKQRSLGKQR